jgi:hypothetical protein
MRADDIPVAHTPPGGYGDALPPPVLAACTEPLVVGAPDLRGTWRMASIRWAGDAPDPDPLATHVERIEQCGDRVCITAGGVVHDMRADGTEEHGVHDVASVGGAPITVVCTFEDDVHVLRPVARPGVQVTRHLEGDDLVWDYGGLFVARLTRSDD